MNFMQLGRPSRPAMSCSFKVDTFHEAAKELCKKVKDFETVEVTIHVGRSYFVYKKEKGASCLTIPEGASSKQRDKIWSDYKNKSKQITSTLTGYQMNPQHFEALKNELKDKIQIDNYQLVETAQKTDVVGSSIKKNKKRKEKEDNSKKEDSSQLIQDQESHGSVVLSVKNNLPSQPTLIIKTDKGIPDAAISLKNHINEKEKGEAVFVKGNISYYIKDEEKQVIKQTCKFTYTREQKSFESTSTRGMELDNSDLDFFEKLEMDHYPCGPTTLEVKASDISISNTVISTFSQYGIKFDIQLIKT